MQMTGEQRIPASRQKVWDGLQDPEILARCIPGCQSITKESDHKLRATAEIKIGPIGARLNGTVTLSDIDPLNGYTMTIEGQGGTVGFVKSGAKVRLTDDGVDATRLAYEVEAQVGGRLAQLGGPIIDATAKQLTGKFFKQFAAVVGPQTATSPAAVETASAAPGSSGSQTQTRQSTTRVTSASPRGNPVAWLLALIVASLVGYLIGHAQHGGGGDSDWMGLAIGMLVAIVAAAAFEFGRRAAAPVVTLDPSFIRQLIEEARR